MQAEAAKVLWVVDPEESFGALDALVAMCEEFYKRVGGFWILFYPNGVN